MALGTLKQISYVVDHLYQQVRAPWRLTPLGQ